MAKTGRYRYGFHPAGDPRTQVVLGFGLILFWFVIGTVGFLLIEEGWTILDAFYMTVITITTVGFEEIHPLTPSGRGFVVVLAIGGLGTILYTLTRMAQLLFEGELVDFLGKRRMMSEIESMEDHYIVCGFGKVGRPVVEGLSAEGLPVVLIERDPDLETTIQDLDVPYIIGDATQEEVLEKAGIDHAETLLGLLPSDADNLYLTIAGLDLNPNIKVIARAADQSGEVRLKRAGAHDVVSPTRIAGLRVLQAAVNPTAVEFMEIVTQQQALQLSLADIEVSGKSSLAGRTIADCEIRGQYGVIIVAVKREKDMEFNPEPSYEISAGDVLVVLGEDLDLVQFQVDASGRR
ncbi:MAG: potassium channel protein [Gemmatimonadota bacterium]|nr:potassium channel protein [Gemmatimonadota bacterium]